VPPPPVAGAAAGGWLAGWLLSFCGFSVVDPVLGSFDSAADGLVLAPPLLGEPLGVVDEVLAPGTDGEGRAEGGAPEQAVTVAGASMITAPQPITVSFAPSRVPAKAARTLMEPPAGADRRQTPADTPVIPMNRSGTQ
jgi:hypothetical protein